MNVLLSAYACEPGKGSEPEVGWQWALQMARFHNVTVLTRTNNRAAIEAALREIPEPRPAFEFRNLHRFFGKLKAGAQACRRLGKPCGIIGMNPEMAAKFVDYGFSWVAVGSDLGFVVSRGQEYLAAMRGAAAPTAKPQSAY